MMSHRTVLFLLIIPQPRLQFVLLVADDIEAVLNIHLSHKSHYFAFNGCVTRLLTRVGAESTTAKKLGEDQETCSVLRGF